MVGFKVTCHKLGPWAGKASPEELFLMVSTDMGRPTPRSGWHLLVAAQIVGTGQKEDYLFTVCLHGLPLLLS